MVWKGVHIPWTLKREGKELTGGREKDIFDLRSTNETERALEAKSRRCGDLKKRESGVDKGVGIR